VVGEGSKGDNRSSRRYCNISIDKRERERERERESGIPRCRGQPQSAIIVRAISRRVMNEGQSGAEDRENCA